ncbi:hypothetical protein AVEN_25275-1 [Araneus ventricosus]|nr:hypothetical protein AVEN_25275-1 [Araneus ventricosus]
MEHDFQHELGEAEHELQNVLGEMGHELQNVLGEMGHELEKMGDCLQREIRKMGRVLGAEVIKFVQERIKPSRQRKRQRSPSHGRRPSVQERKSLPAKKRSTE